MLRCDLVVLLRSLQCVYCETKAGSERPCQKNVVRCVGNRNEVENGDVGELLWVLLGTDILEAL